MRHSFFILLFFSLISSSPLSAKTHSQLKPRLVVLTDIGDCNVEPDDMESAIRLLCYADQIEIEAIMTTVGWNCDPYPDGWEKYLYKVVDAYSKDVYNLRKRSNQSSFYSIDKENTQQEIGYWPSPEYIRLRCMPGSHKAGIAVIGENNNTKGSDFLIKLADEDDPRPIYVAAWGSGNTLAQAIWKVKQTRTKEQLKAFLHKFRIYTITDQDMVYNMRMNRAYSSHQWLRSEFKDDLQFIWDEGTWQLQCELGKQNWQIHKHNIQGHGALGSAYPDYKWGVEGDTPSFLYIIPNGLSNPEDPAQAGWAGCHKFGLCPDSLTLAWTSWEVPQKSITEHYKKKFYPDELNDFCARIQWAQNGKGNTNPIVSINGKQSLTPHHIKAKTGKSITLDASKSYDAEGDNLSFLWWNQSEESSCKSLGFFADKKQSKTKITIPNNAKGQTFHIICEVHDNGPFHLVSYARIIIDVE